MDLTPLINLHKELRHSHTVINTNRSETLREKYHQKEIRALKSYSIKLPYIQEIHDVLIFSVVLHNNNEAGIQTRIHRQIGENGIQNNACLTHFPT